MKIKSSKSSSLYVIVVCAVIILALFSLQSFNKKKFAAIEVPKIKQKTQLNSIQITLKDKHYRKIKKKRNQFLVDGIMESSDDDYVPAIVTFNAIDYDADIRLKGDWTDHLEGKKWSYRIKLKNDQTILGMRKFSIHHPKSRGYINEWLFHKVNKDEGLFGLKYHFAEGFLHIKLKNSNNFIDKEVGIYAIEESFDKRTIESNQRKEGIILRISEQYFWKEVKAGHKIEKHIGYKWRPTFSPTYYLHISSYVSSFGLEKTMANEALHTQFITAKNLLENYRNGNLNISEVFDVNKLALYIAITNLFGAYHGLSEINLRFYYNPTTSKLEPIAYDGNPGYELKTFHHYFNTKGRKDEEYTRALIKALNKVSNPSYLNLIFKNYNESIKDLENILAIEFNNDSKVKKESLFHNQTILKKELERLKWLDK